MDTKWFFVVRMDRSDLLDRWLEGGTFWTLMGGGDCRKKLDSSSLVSLSVAR